MMWARRSFLKAAALATGGLSTRAMAGVGRALIGSEQAALPAQVPALLPGQLAADPRRPEFHLLPTHNWMNDPNAPVYFEGRYHMYFQFNPKGATWGNMSWGHASSADMLHWEQHPVAFTMTPGGPDAAGCFSGSALVEQGEGGKPRLYAVYTGVVRDPEHETVPHEGLRESQCLAWTDDPAAAQWTKLPQPIIPHPPEGMQITGFRDPSAWKHGDGYLMTVGSGVVGKGGCVLLYSAKDLRGPWTYLHPVASGSPVAASGGNPVGSGEMWECPDLFALGKGHVLIYATQGKVLWQSGQLDPQTLRFTALKQGVVDTDAFYAAKSQTDRDGNRILWGWIPERRPNSAMLEAGWSGMMSLPRLLTLDDDGTLRMRILPAAAGLRGQAIPVKESGGGTQVILPAANGKFNVQGNAGSELTCTVLVGDTEVTRVTYSPEQHRFLVKDGTVALEAGDVPAIHGFVDGSVVELILSERLGVTKRFYYPGKTAPDLTVRISGQKANVRAWRVQAISRDRLTGA